MEERIIKRLMTSVKCSSCGYNYAERNIQVIGQQHGMWFLSVYCSSCHTHYLLAATVSHEKAKVVSDLTEAEFIRFNKSRAPTADDILDMHNFLKKFNGDFTHLFRRERVS